MSKFDKFTMVDPLGADEEEKSMQEMVANEVNDRMGRAVGELKDKYEKGGKGYDAASDAQPTGAAYAQAREQEKQRKKAIRDQRRAAEAATREEDAELAAQMKASARLNGEVDSEDEEGGDGGSDDVDSDDELLAGLDADPEICRIRESRLREMKRVHEARAENIAKGHGQYREIVQDEFLPEVTSSEKVVVHFYHKDFQRCKVMDMRLGELAPRHLETKFLRIDAEKAPFFVQKLQARGVKILPTVICFIDGVAVHNIIGFDGLTAGLPPDKLDEWPLSNLARELALAKAIIYSQRDAPEGTGPREQGGYTGAIRAGLNDGDFSDEDG
ncbi:unnamed protein product [Ectocarpus sp. 6 AP-2014]